MNGTIAASTIQTWTKMTQSPCGPVSNHIWWTCFADLDEDETFKPRRNRANPANLVALAEENWQLKDRLDDMEADQWEMRSELKAMNANSRPGDSQSLSTARHQQPPPD